jgi:hypothetical protein
LHEACIESVHAYCLRHGIKHLVQREPILRIRPIDSCRSREAVEKLGYLPVYEKENAFAHLVDHDQVAVIDGDIFVVDDSVNVFDDLGDADFAGVIERDMPLTSAYKGKLKVYSEGQYGPLRKEADFDWNEIGAGYFNMGLMLMNASILKYVGGTPMEFVRRPEFKRFVDGEGQWRWSTDQTLLNWWVRTSGMKAKPLSWRWNALFKGVRDECLREARFVHFFLSAHLPKKGAEVMSVVERIRAGDCDFSSIKGRS